MKEYDVVVIGSGPGGYTSAIRCSQLGLKTAIIEKYQTLGGTCLNVGCIPSKALLDSSEKYHELTHSFENHGIKANNVKLDFSKMIDRTKDVVLKTCDGIKYLMGKNKITTYHGLGSFVDSHTLKISGENEETIKAKNIIIATGSKPSSLPGIKIDKKRIITSTEALYLEKLPKSMVVIGGGVIGLELGSVYQRLGCDVSIVEYVDSLLGSMDKDLSKEMLKVLKKSGMKFFLSHGVNTVENSGKKTIIKATNNKKKEEVSFEAEYCLVAVGRRAYTDKLNLNAIDIDLDERGRIPVNSNLETKHSHIYAIGDVIQGAMLAHKAEEEGIFVAETISGQKPHINHHLIPGVVYTWPEIASVGFTEEELKANKTSYKKGKFPFSALGRARASEDLDGFVKVLADKNSDEILGVHMIGARAADLIAEAVMSMEFRASAEDVTRTCHAHPTFSEAFKEACLAATDNRAINI